MQYVNVISDKDFSLAAFKPFFKWVTGASLCYSSAVLAANCHLGWVEINFFKAPLRREAFSCGGIMCQNKKTGDFHSVEKQSVQQCFANISVSLGQN